MSELSEERIQELVEEAERGYDPKTIKPRHGGLGDVPELDYDALRELAQDAHEHYRDEVGGLRPDVVLALLDDAHAARERIEALEAAAAEYVLATEARIEQLEGQVERLNAILDEVASQMPAEKNPFNTEWHRAIDMVEGLSGD